MKATRRYLEAAQRVYIACHIIPDGDAVGSLLGLGWTLRRLGKECTMACADPVPLRFDFLSGADEIVAHPPSDEEIIVAVDSSDTERLGALYDPAVFASRPVINIDHHITNTRFGTENLVYLVPSTAEIIYALVRRLGVHLDEDIATPLLTGLITDTRCFRTGNVTARQLRTAVALMRAGASITDITERVFNHKSISTICLWGQALAGVQTQDRIVWTEVDRETQRRCAASANDLGGLVSFLGGTRGVDVAIVFTEKDDGHIEASMRAGPGLDVSGVAFKLGGGGHPRAAGCSIDGDMTAVRERVLGETKAALKEQAEAKE